MGEQSIVCCSTETEQNVSITVKKPNVRYLNRFLRSKCCTDILGAGVFQPTISPAKEITEAMALVRAVQRLLPFKTSAVRDKHIIVVGDGSTPRLGACLAFFSPHYVVSVDPRLRQGGGWSLPDGRIIDRLYTVRKKIQDIQAVPPDILVLPHAHVTYRDFAHLAPRLIIAMPCCKDFSIPSAHYLMIERYNDWGVLSPKREIAIYERRQ